MQKKLISLFLSALILISCFSVGFIAFAEEAQEQDAAVETAVDATKADEATEMLEMYLELAQREDEMTKTQREKFDAVKAYLNNSFNTLTSEETITQVKKMLADVTETAATALKGGPVGAFEKSVNAYEGKVSTANPSEEDLAGYEALVTAYNKLSDAQKGEIEIMTFDKFLHLVLDREYYVERAKYEKAPASKVLYGNAYKNAVALLGKAGYVADFDAAAELATVLANSKATAQEKLDAFAAANANARAYSAVWYASYGTFYYKLDASNIKTSVEKIMDAFGKELDASDKFTETAPEKPKKPSKPSSYDKNKYPQGENDPAYIKDMAEYTDVLLPAYLEKQEPYSKWEARKNNHSIQHKMEGLDTLAAAAPEYAPIAKMMKDALAAVEAFEESSANIAPAKKVVADFEKMTPYQQAFTKNNSINVRSVASMNSSGDNWSTSYQTASKMYTQCGDIAQYDKLTAFIAVIDSITEPYTNDDIVRAKDAYNEVPSGLRANIPEEINVKYKAILASIAPDRPSLEKPDLSVFKKTVVTYPENATKEQVATALPRIQNLLCDVLLPLLGMEGGLTEMVENGIYTNYAVAVFANTLYPLIKDVSGGLISPDFETLAKTLTEEKFAGAVALINKAITEGNKEGQKQFDAADARGEYKDMSKYEKEKALESLQKAEKATRFAELQFPNEAFGFQDGDKEGFLDAAAALFRPLSLLTMVLKFENNINTTNGTYTYNAYELLVPVFEMLDLKGYMSSHEYTLYVNESSSAAKMDARIRPILVPIFNLLDDFAAEPLDTLLDVLPKLAYGLESGKLDEQVQALIGSLGMGLGNSIQISLTTEWLYDTIAPMLKDLVIREAGVNEETGEEIKEVKISINLDKAKFLQMMKDAAGCGDAAVKESKARGTAYRLGINSDKPDAFVVLFRWLYSEITTAENMRAIKTAINTMDINLVGKMAIKVLLNRVAETPTDDALVTLVNLAAPKAPEIKLPDSIEDLLPGKDKDNGNNSGDSKPNTEAPSVPKTGGSIATSMFSVVAVAALAGGAILLKKKQQDEE